MHGRQVSREFKLEAVKLVEGRAVVRRRGLRGTWTCTRTCCASGSLACVFY